jgi:hypothetical protein
MNPQTTHSDFFAAEMMIAGDVSFEERRSFLLDVLS